MNTFSKEPLELQQIIILFCLELISKNFFIKSKSISLRIEDKLLIFFKLVLVKPSLKNGESFINSKLSIALLKFFLSMNKKFGSR